MKAPWYEFGNGKLSQIAKLNEKVQKTEAFKSIESTKFYYEMDINQIRMDGEMHQHGARRPHLQLPEFITRRMAKRPKHS